MNIYQLPSESELPKAPIVLALGNFDGLHLGHRQLIDTLKQVAVGESADAGVYTFDPHPMKLLLASQNFKQLWPRDELKTRFKELGIKHLVLQKFDQEFSQISAQNFINDVLLKFNLKAVVVGFDFHFGHKKSGNVEILKTELTKQNIKVVVLPEFKITNSKVSSRTIKDKILKLDLESAAKDLGENYYIKGKVVSDDKRGRQIGFPTANVKSDWELLLNNGVYKTLTWVDGVSYLSVTNIGYAPTFTDEQNKRVRVETHILDFSRDIYDLNIKVEFIKFLRSEKKFSSKEELIAQIKKDIQEVRN